MRKHRKLILVLILIFIGIPFVFFFGMPTPQNSPEAADTTVMEIGGVPVTESQFRRALDAMAQQMAPRGGQRPTYEEMDAAGQVKLVQEQLLDYALITAEYERRGLNVGNDFLEKQFRDFPYFKDEQGKFKPEAYNEWVNTPRDWDALYEEMRKEFAQQAYYQVMLAPARRVLESKIDEELAADYTKLRIKYAKIELPVTPTEEDIQKQYSENQEDYRKPADNRADYVALSLAPSVPERAVEAVTRARAGEDFAALFKEYSTLTVPEGGDMGWRKVEDNPTEHMAPLYALPVGGVSDPVFGPTGYFIFKVEEERTAEDGKREIHFRQIVMEAKLTDEEMQQRKDEAAALAARAKESDLATAAAEKGLTVAQTGVFTKESNEIAGIPRFDVPVFRTQVPGQKDDTLFTPVQGRSYIYVAKVTETVEGVVPPLDEVRERVTNDTIAALRKREDSQAQLQELCKRIAAEVTALDQIPAKFPELGVEVKVTEKP
ncbi:MAG TPA: SurA N-terminal domain-containing protein, partial [Candidatus Hydrogenedentes bacterium]|nr:SurA N-terminal domain-containing protein [Candidatus Hydrogenedentota bacterium]